MCRFKVRISKIKANNGKADFVIFLLLNCFGFSLQQLDQFREVNSLFGFRMLPKIFTSVAGQQQTTGFAGFMAEVLADKLVA